MPGGEVEIQCRDFRPGLPGASKVILGQAEARIVTASEDRIVTRLPSSPAALGISLHVNGQSSPVFPFVLATEVAGGVHPVTSPVLSQEGDLITTISGKRGEQVQQPLVRIKRTGEKVLFPCEVMNPTGLAFGPDGQLYLSSRHDGTVLRYTDYEELEIYAEDLGVACGIVFDSNGSLFVGDRTGKIYRVDSHGTKEEYAVLEPSVSAYHLAMDGSDRLYVTGPTLAMRDALYRVPARGQVEILVRGLARPQGMAFLPGGELLIAAAFAGKKGVFKYSPRTGQLSHYIAAPTLVGVAVSRDEIFLADNSSIYRVGAGLSSMQVV